MARHFGKFEGNLVRKEHPVAIPKIKDEIRPFLAQRARDQHEKEVGYEMSKKAFNVWVIKTALSRGRADASDHITSEALNGDKRYGEEAEDDRFNYVQNISQGELHHELNNSYRGRGEVSANSLPDIVIVSGGKGYIDNDKPRPQGSGLAQAMLKYETQPIEDIRKAADSTLYLPGLETGDPIKDGRAFEFLFYNILGNAYARNTFESSEATDALILENICTDLFQTEADHEIAAKRFDAYARTGDESLIRTLVTPGRVRKALERQQKFSALQYLSSLEERRGISDTTTFSNKEDALRVYNTRSEQMRDLLERISITDLQDALFETLKRLIDKRKDEYINDAEFEAAEHRLLQPLIVATGPSELYLEAALERGADGVIKNPTQEDLEKVTALAQTIRTSPASVAAERLQRNKSDFYRSVVDQIEDRSTQTADTEQELSILKSIFEKRSAKKILDVGSGYGRLMIPFASDGFDVTGLEANRQLTEKAKQSAKINKRLHFRSGNLINYTDSVEKKSFDAVYYGWHSFLEAYGLGNALSTLRSARLALRPGGTITFDQPSRENTGLEDGWYGDEEHGYLAYLMDEDELKFLLRLAGFENAEIIHWTTKPSELYPEGMKKITVVAQKPLFGLPESA